MLSKGQNERNQITIVLLEDLVPKEHLLRQTEYADLYKQRKETIERVFADAKEKHAMRYTPYRGLAQVSNWVRLKFAAMNLNKRKWRDNHPSDFLLFFSPFDWLHSKTHIFALA